MFYQELSTDFLSLGAYNVSAGNFINNLIGYLRHFRIYSGGFINVDTMLSCSQSSGGTFLYWYVQNNPELLNSASSITCENCSQLVCQLSTSQIATHQCIDNNCKMCADSSICTLCNSGFFEFHNFHELILYRIILVFFKTNKTNIFGIKDY